MNKCGANDAQQQRGRKPTPIGNQLKNAAKQLRNPTSRSNTAEMPADMPQGNAN